MLGQVPLRCKDSQGTNLGQHVGSLTTVTSMRIPLHFRPKQLRGVSLNGLVKWTWEWLYLAEAKLRARGTWDTCHTMYIS